MKRTAVALTLVLGLTAFPALAELFNPFTNRPESDGDVGNKIGEDVNAPASEIPSYLVCVVKDARSDEKNGLTAVLVRGNAYDDTINNPLPTVSYLDGNWGLDNGIVHNIASLGSDGEFFFSGLGSVYAGLTGIKAGDTHISAGLTSFSETGILVSPNADRWAGVANYYNPGTVPTYETAYPYYLFIFDTSASGGLIDENADLLGMWYEDHDPGLHEIQSGSTRNNIQDVHIVHFGSGSFIVLPEPTAAALLTLGAACLGLRRRFRRPAAG